MTTHIDQHELIRPETGIAWLAVDERRPLAEENDGMECVAVGTGPAMLPGNIRRDFPLGYAGTQFSKDVSQHHFRDRDGLAHRREFRCRLDLP